MLNEEISAATAVRVDAELDSDDRDRPHGDWMLTRMFCVYRQHVLFLSIRF